MNQTEFESPVVLFIYNRPKLTKRVIKQIAKVKPKEFLVVGDGPKKNERADYQKVKKTRTIIDNEVDWNCDLRTNYAKENLGLRDRFISGLNWVFSNVEKAIILEDDCVPSKSFFHFCDSLLDRYEGDERIMDISGTNYLGKWKPDSQDYHFSLYGGIWGWATWQDSWKWYDPNMELWDDPEVKARIRDRIADDNQFGYLKYIYDKTYDNEIDTWDYQWMFAKHRNAALSIVPSKNLVSNIGFTDAATHNSVSKWEDLQRHELNKPLREKNSVGEDRDYDREFHKMRPISMRNRTLRYFRRLYEQYLGD